MSVSDISGDPLATSADGPPAGQTGGMVPPQQPIVEIDDLRKVYRSWSWTGRQRVEALAGVTLRAYPGEVFGLLGPNGAGKTTLIKTLLGVIQPSGGRASLFNLPLGSAVARRRVGYLPESLRIDGHHTARSALRFYGRLSRMDEATIRRRSGELLELVGLRNRDRESIRRFSKGMSQRLGLAQALMHDPDLLILDEPTDGLDPVGRNAVRGIIQRLRDDGKTIFLNSHILQEVELICTRVGIMAHGKLRGIGTIDELARAHETDRVVLEAEPARDRDGLRDDAYSDLRDCLAAAFPGQAAATSPADGSGEAFRVDPLPGGERWRLTAAVTSQSDIDRVVDRLRGGGFSIVSLRSHRPSLEETFLRLVGEPEAAEVGDRP